MDAEHEKLIKVARERKRRVEARRGAHYRASHHLRVGHYPIGSFLIVISAVVSGSVLQASGGNPSKSLTLTAGALAVAVVVLESMAARSAVVFGAALALATCGGHAAETGIPPVTTGEGATIAAGADALAWRAAEVICSQSTLAVLAARYGVKRRRTAVAKAVAANFPQSKRAARMGCRSGFSSG
jgi:hypothetical protein